MAVIGRQCRCSGALTYRIFAPKESYLLVVLCRSGQDLVLQEDFQLRICVPAFRIARSFLGIF